MRHRRLRKFNQRQVRYYDGQRLANDMCMPSRGWRRPIC